MRSKINLSLSLFNTKAATSSQGPSRHCLENTFDVTWVRYDIIRIFFPLNFSRKVFPQTLLFRFLEQDRSPKLVLTGIFFFAKCFEKNFFPNLFYFIFSEQDRYPKLVLTSNFFYHKMFDKIFSSISSSSVFLRSVSESGPNREKK